MDGKHVVLQTQRQEQPRYHRLETSLLFTIEVWDRLQSLQRKFQDRTKAHLIKRALTLLERMEPHVRGDSLYVLARQPSEAEVKAGEVIKISI